MTLGDQEMAERRLVCGQGRVDEERELEFDEECVAGSNIQHFRRQVCVCVCVCAVGLHVGQILRLLFLSYQVL